MNVRPALSAVVLGLVASTGVAAQSGPSSALVAAPASPAPVSAEVLRAELIGLTDVLERQADALAHGLLPTRIAASGVVLPAAGGGGFVGALGTVTSAFGPLSNSVSSLTFERDPALSNSTSETFAAIGLGSAVVGGVLNLIAGGGGDDGVAIAPSRVDLGALTGEFGETQESAERLIDRIDRLSDEAGDLTRTLEGGAVTAETRSATLALLRRAERVFLRYDYLTRRAISELAALRAGFASQPDHSADLRTVNAAETRLHTAIDEVRSVGLNTAFDRVGMLRARLEA